MTREEFIKIEWLSYPSWPPPMGQWAGGRVVELSDQSVTLLHNENTACLPIKQGLRETDPYFGKSIPPEFLRLGDVIAYSLEQQGPSPIFLLAPNQSQEEKEDSHSWCRWHEFVDQVQNFFTSRHFLGVQTPMLVTSPGVDHHIDYFQVVSEAGDPLGTLPTSPEIHLKKLLCRGYDRVFEIKPCFRNDLLGEHHQKEFTMLEWYRSFSDLEQIQQDITNLVQELSQHFSHLEDLPVQVTTVRELFFEYLNANLSPLTPDQQLRSWAQEQGIDCAEDDSWNDLFFRLFMEKVEPHLGKKGLCFVYDWPASQASLARVKNSWAQRFELYWQGVELANAYNELNSPQENKKVFYQQNQLREGEGKQASPVDVEFFADLDRGMPPSVGVALGLDRLFMLATGQTDIRATRPFPML